MKAKFFFFFSLLLAFGVLAAVGRNDTDLTVNPIYKTSSMEGLHITHKEGGIIKWELTADDAVLPAGNEQVIVKSPDLMIFNEPAIHLTGGSGIYNIEEGDLAINGMVNIHIKDVRFTTNSLTWSGKDEILSTRESVKITGNNFFIEGIGLSAKIKDQKMKILDNVKGTFYL
jgi:LPS export ABC transporter protein LptC